MMARSHLLVALLGLCILFIFPVMAQDNPYRYASDITDKDIAVNVESGIAKVSDSSNVTFSGAEYTHTLGRVSIRMKPLMEEIDKDITFRGNIRTSGKKNQVRYLIYQDLIKEEIILNTPEVVRYSYELSLSDWVTKKIDTSKLQIKGLREWNRTEIRSQILSEEIIDYAKDSTVDIQRDRWGNLIIYVNGKDIVVISKPFATDATGKRFELDFDLDKKNKIITIIGHLTGAQYPLVIDPTERVTNGDFQTGDFSGWSFSSTGDHADDCWYEIGPDYEGGVDYICLFLVPGDVTQARVFQTVNLSDISTLNFQRELGGWTDYSPPGNFSVNINNTEVFSEDCLNSDWTDVIQNLNGFGGLQELNFIVSTVGYGAWAEIDDVSIMSTDQAPIISFTAIPLSGPSPLTVQFTDTSTGSPTSWSWDFGDGDTSMQQNPSHTYTAPGTYDVSLTAANAVGSDTEKTVDYVTVTAPGPVADFTGAPTSGTIPLSVWFTDRSTGSPTTWSWDFGDGLTATEQNPYHVYTNVTNGPYTVSLTVKNGYGENTKVKQNYVTLVVPTQTSTTVSPTYPNQKSQKTYKLYAEVGTYSTTDSAKGFWETINGASNKGITWTYAQKLIAKTDGGGCLNDYCPAASHWTSNASQWIGQADFLFYSGHGGRGSLWFEDDYGLFASAEDMGLDSTGKTKWVVFDSCDTMYNGADSNYSRWIPQFNNGLHMLLGWHTNANYWDNGMNEFRGLVFAELMRGIYNDKRTHTIREAWYLTGLNNYQAAIHKTHISHDTWNAVMYWNGCENDYLPGWNKFCTDPGVSGLITWEPRFIAAQDNFGDSGLSSSILSLSDDTYSLAASVPVTNESAVIYKPVKSEYSKEQASSLAKSLGMSGDIRETDDAFYTSDSDAEQFLFSVQKNSSMIVFRNNTPRSGTVQTIQSEAQVILATNTFLRKNNLMPSGELEPRVVNNSIVTYTRSGTVANERNVYAVIYPRSIDGLPVFNAQFNVEADSESNVIGLFKNWRDYEPAGKITLKSPEEAFGEFKTHPPKSKTIVPEKVRVTGVSLGYSTQTSADGEEYLQPVYIFEGNNQRGNSVEPFEPVIINAKKEEKR